MYRNDVAALRRLVHQNRDVLAVARTILGRECRIVLAYEPDFFSKHCENMQHLRSLSIVFSVEGHLAYLEGRWTDAARIGLDLLELANTTGRGGLLCDHMVGWSIALSGINSLRRCRTEYDEMTLAHLLEQLPQIEANRDSLEAVLERDRKWEQVAKPLEEPFDPTFLELSAEEAQNMSEEEIAAYYEMIDLTLHMPDEDRFAMQLELENRVIATWRLMTLDTALRTYRAMTGTFPQQLAELVPGVLPTVPCDPYTESEFIYRPKWRGIFSRSIKNFLLYSPGPGQHDHGGTFGPYPQVALDKADLCLDEPDYWPGD